MIRAVWQSFWGDLNTPSAFRDDPAGAAANQAGHLAIGAFAAAFLSLAYCAIYGEMPFRIAVWLGVTWGYLVAVEWLTQGWKGGDSIIDGAFVSLGAAVPLASLKEVSFQPRVVLEPRPEQGLLILATIAVALAVYVYPRAVRKWRGSHGGVS